MGWRISDGRIDRVVVFAEIDGARIPAGEIVFQGRARRLGTFRYARTWIDAKRPPLVPVDLPVRARGFEGTPNEAPLAFYDAIPDGWGLSILKRTFPSQVFGIAEQLAACGDDRTGFLSCGPTPDASERWIPEEYPAMHPATGSETFDDLVAAALAADNEQASPTQLRALFRTSADIGGARPKARIRRDGRDWIAKLPAVGDAFDEPRIEAVCLAIAGKAKIDVPAFRVDTIAGRSVLSVERFDRRQGSRLGYMSAATLVRQPYVQYRADSSYAEIAAAARRVGIIPCETELFRRMLVNGFVNNTDDHLRNHGFVFDGSRWRLSPVFDVVTNRQKLPVLRSATGRAPTTDPIALLEAHEAFGLDRTEAEGIYADVADACREIEDVLEAYRVTKVDQGILRNIAGRLFEPPAMTSSVGWRKN
jgi:serine/threonine-protein kinase HipA